MRRERMPNDVRRQAVEDARFLPIRAKQLPKRLPQHRAAPVAYKKIRARSAFQQARPAAVKVMFDRPKRRFSDWNDALLIPLAKDSHITKVPFHIRHSHATELGNPQTCGIQELEH